MSLSEEVLTFIISTIRKNFSASEYEIILFGSYAKGEEKKNSDIDIAIKGKGPLPLAKWQLVDSAFEESYLKQKIDVVDYYRVQKDFQKIIDDTGILLKPKSES